VDQKAVLETIKSQIAENDIVLYMKGTKETPQCGFSSAVSKLLTELQLPYIAVNVLENPDLREGIKEFTDWPTIPQLYVKGEFVGGYDIVCEAYETGELEGLLKDIVASSAKIGILLQESIGDTIRFSLTPEPGGDRTLEVKAAQELLQTMGFRAFAPLVAACPGCGRTTSTVFQTLARDIQSWIAASIPQWRRTYPGVESLSVAVMGCIVNGPGESKHADIGISLPGTGEEPAAPVFIDGRRAVTLRGSTLAEDFKTLVEDYIRRRYGNTESGAASYAHQEGVEKIEDAWTSQGCVSDGES